MPEPARAPGRTFLGASGPVALAHRGGAAHPENSLAAFDDAVALGYRFLETDVHATADGVLVALHDPTLDRTTDGTGPLSALTWEQVSRLRLRDATGAVTQHAPVRLEDLLDAWADQRPRVRLNVDVKEVGAVAPMVALLAARRRDAHRVCVASFSDGRRRAVVAALAARGVPVTSSAGTAGVLRFLVGARLGLRGKILRALVGADALQVPQTSAVAGRQVRIVTGLLVEAAHSAGLSVHVWTVDDPTDVHRLLDLGVDGIVTDDAAAVREVLRERGAWPPRIEDPTTTSTARPTANGPAAAEEPRS
ncbi:glycerophosphoryl diester phosphodiesterase [Quadrisphaera granulorum]|uniref:Glycerophosphoryl diester phosphodiesterase n=1 Tax=Quadrisphaera granulorum TaxID=317664 RepID=A0A316A6Y2_9ACTN|nr:glycerophosphodiester phosphodiesterase family protein [Quadrisphaera granulorum]PWJ53199.1 glycerophosphoryl diester phosphodiesterase [Quadrisphaera granulorum]SZE97131.1 glycerophosphoryl diester phosphodiesterase [Quadrisphaera granulorum]